jgi:hypothetical protein
MNYTPIYFRIQIQKKMKKSRSKFLKIVDEKHDINFHWPNNWIKILNKYRSMIGVEWNLFLENLQVEFQMQCILGYEKI